ncbi:MAG: SDR family oxidoreductase [Chloroflexi bacterium]|jgi:NAD(P)-dependent dehydrogenase (short-subunit alcohol dehydrogenase family)|nr:SDR family oxidoreductase [Chloroflexota bacterium]MBT4074504.1 SDR family oxidoreductase [Chloroflexota bacterium]MBT4515943.1 SDR family oxidoreductase [Chloroflexota bacterium]MBT6682142.1 SDR family oxidoreductase [Chloroflexota bacterium]
MPLDGKRIVLTGAASGIGKATALRVAAEGARVAMLDVNDDEGQRLAEAIGDQTRYWHANVADEAAVKEVIGEAAEWLGGIDVLLHVAGVLDGANINLPAFSEETWDRVIDINLKGSFLVAKHVAAVMEPNKQGVMVLTASGAGVKGGSSSFAYGSSKGGVHGLAMVLEQRLAPLGIRVNDVAPGNIDTPLKVAQVRETYEITRDSDNFERTMSSLADPSGVAAVMAFLASDDADYVRGTIFTR